MERKFYTNDFEQLLKDKTDEFRMYPSKRVWHSIYNDLHPGRKWPSIAVSMVLVIVLLMMGYWNNNTSKSAIAKVVPTYNKNTTNNDIAGIKASFAAHDNASQQNDISPIAYQNKTSIQEPFGIYKNITEIKSATSLLADNKNTAAHQPAINWNIALGQFNNIATIISSSSSWLTNSALLGVNDLNYKNKNRIATGTDEPNNATALQQTENKTLIALPANVKNKLFATVDKKSENVGLSVDADKENAVGANSIATEEDISDKVDKATNAGSKSPIVTGNAKATAEQDRSFIDNYAFYNKSKRKKWQDRTALEFYITPSVGYRHLSSDAKYNLPTVPLGTAMNVNQSVNQKPALGAEAGLDIIYTLAKNIRVKAGVQMNYTNYSLNADETGHPILSSLLLTDPATGYTRLQSATTTLANTTTGSEPVKLHNKTYQFSIPVGIALKLSGNNKLEWYAGATIQPTFVMGGKAYLISADRKNYIADASLIRKWNVNAGLETYISYKLDNFTLLAGPQVRYQLFSTYSKNYTVTEKLYNVGVKIGILKNF